MLTAIPQLQMKTEEKIGYIFHSPLWWEKTGLLMSRASSRINELSGSIFHNELDSKLKNALTRLGSLLKEKSSARLSSAHVNTWLNSARLANSRVGSRAGSYFYLFALSIKQAFVMSNRAIVLTFEGLIPAYCSIFFMRINFKVQISISFYADKFQISKFFQISNFNFFQISKFFQISNFKNLDIAPQMPVY